MLLMTRSRLRYNLLLCTILLASAIVGCSDDENGPNAGNCGLIIMEPAAGGSYREYESVPIYWDHDGSVSSVRIELLQGTEVVGDIEAHLESDGYYEWFTDSLGEPDGNDFYIRVTAIGNSVCYDSLGPLTIDNSISPEAIAFLMAHYDDRFLVQAYTSSTTTPYPELGDYWLERRAGAEGLGGKYFKDDLGRPIIINDTSELHNLPLYVSAQEDLVEYLWNAARWDQFIFGWDDFERPESTIGPDPTYNLKDLSQPRTSTNRGTYKQMIGLEW